MPLLRLREIAILRTAKCFSEVERLVLQFTDEVNANVKPAGPPWRPSSAILAREAIGKCAGPSE
jgi:hypothetical protein